GRCPALTDRPCSKKWAVYISNRCQRTWLIWKPLSRGCSLDTVNSIAHRLKSVAGNIGARELAALFSELECTASAMQLREANTSLRKIKVEFKRTAIAREHEMT